MLTLVAILLGVLILCTEVGQWLAGWLFILGGTVLAVLVVLALVMGHR